MEISGAFSKHDWDEAIKVLLLYINKNRYLTQ